MLLDSEIQSYKDELEELRQDADRLKKKIIAAVNDGEDDLVAELREREKSLIQYIQDLVDELGGGDGRGNQENFSSEEPRGSFGHTLLHSTIAEPEDEVADGSDSDYSISYDPRADREGPAPSGSEQTELAGTSSGAEEYEDSQDPA